MPNFDDVAHIKGRRPDRRSFLRTTGIAAAAAVFGNHALPALGQQGAKAASRL